LYTIAATNAMSFFFVVALGLDHIARLRIAREVERHVDVEGVGVAGGEREAGADRTRGGVCALAAVAASPTRIIAATRVV
jgi:hypothetical protein